MSIADEIGKLDELRRSGALSESEYQKAKDTLLAGMVAKPPAGGDFARSFDALASDTNAMAMALHLSQFCGFVVPVAGLIVPIVLWQIWKDKSPILDQHGRNVVNWMLTELILAAVFALLCFVLIGIPLLWLLVLAGIVFPIIGGVKAYQGQLWRYPGSFTFFAPENGL